MVLVSLMSPPCHAKPISGGPGFDYKFSVGIGKAAIGGLAISPRWLRPGDPSGPGKR